MQKQFSKPFQAISISFAICLFVSTISFSQSIIKDTIEIAPKKNLHSNASSSFGGDYPTVTFTFKFSGSSQMGAPSTRILGNDPCTGEYNLDDREGINGTYSYILPAPPPSVGIGFFYYAWEDEGDSPLTYSIDGVFNYDGSTFHTEGVVNPRLGGAQNPEGGGIYQDTPYITGFDFVLNGSMNFHSSINLNYTPWRDPDPSYLDNGMFYAHMGTLCGEPTVWSESRDPITLQITSGSDYVSFYDAETGTQNKGDKVTVLASDLNTVSLYAYAPSQVPVTVTVKATGGMGVEKERSITLLPYLLDHFDVQANPNMIGHNGATVLKVQAKDKDGADVDFDGDLQVTASPDGYGELEANIPSIAPPTTALKEPVENRPIKLNKVPSDRSIYKLAGTKQLLRAEHRNSAKSVLYEKVDGSSEPVDIGYSLIQDGYLKYIANGPTIPENSQLITFTVTSDDDPSKSGTGTVTVSNSDESKLVVTYPTDNLLEEKNISAEPKMPDIIAKAKLENYKGGTVNFQWNLRVQWEGGDGTTFDDAFPGNTTALNSTESSWTIDWKNMTRGGDEVTLDVTATADGKTYEQTVTHGFKIVGINPSPTQIRDGLSVEEQVLVYKESKPKWHHFIEDHDFPIFGPKHGYGLMQIDNPRATKEQVWNWKANKSAGQSLYGKKKGQAKSYSSRINNGTTWHYDDDGKKQPTDPIGKHFDWYPRHYTQATALTDGEALLKESFQRYHGGVYWRWKPEDDDDDDSAGKWEKGTIDTYGDNAWSIYDGIVNHNTYPPGWKLERSGN